MSLKQGEFLKKELQGRGGNTRSFFSWYVEKERRGERSRKQRGYAESGKSLSIKRWYIDTRQKRNIRSWKGRTVKKKFGGYRPKEKNWGQSKQWTVSAGYYRG